jgi:2-desacetyl-2-hydroxyethyl bacteriochlorophyllide A dehydrogenase
VTEEGKSTMDSLNVVFTGQRELELRREPVPAVGPRQVRVRTRKSLISIGTELICYERRFEPNTHWDGWVKYPFYSGYSNAGVVEEVGAEITHLKPGDRVASRVSHRERGVVDVARTVPIPEGVTDEEATWYALAGIVQNGVRRAEHELGDAIAIIGMGPLGQLVTQYARLAGAREVIAIDTAAARLEMARQHGATQTLSIPAGEAVEAVKELTDGRGADIVYDVTGHPAVLPCALRLARRFGKVILLGDAGTPSEQRLTSDVVTRGLRIIGAHDANPPQVATDHLWWSHTNQARLFFTYVARKQMRVADLVTHRYHPEQARECYDGLVADRSAAMGVIFDWDQL